jgi:hypothetical protein
MISKVIREMETPQLYGPGLGTHKQLRARIHKKQHNAAWLIFYYFPVGDT